MKKKYDKPQMNIFEVPSHNLLAGSNPSMNLHDESNYLEEDDIIYETKKFCRRSLTDGRTCCVIK